MKDRDEYRLAKSYCDNIAIRGYYIAMRIEYVLDSK